MQPEKSSYGPLHSHFTTSPHSTVTDPGVSRTVYHVCKGKNLSLGYETIQPHCKVLKLQQLWVFVAPYRLQVPTHSHETQEEILYFISGSGTAHINGETFEIRAGSTLLIPVGAEHGFSNDSDEVMTLTYTFSPPNKLDIGSA